MPDKKRFYLLGAVVLLAMLLAGLLLRSQQSFEKSGVIRIGILHSLSGTMAFSEASVVDATLFAIEEINASGGLLGKRIEPVIADGKSDWPTFAREAERLIAQEKVDVLFGCWTSASRKAVKPVVEKHRHLLFNPVQHEGLESSPHIIYGGQSANQQVIPAVNWSLQYLGRRFYLIGSDYVFPRAVNAIVRDQLRAVQAEIAGESYLPLGSRDVAALVADIRASRPDVIINSINGDSNIAFFKALRSAGITTPVMSFSISEVEVQQLGDLAEGSYAAWSYFQSLKNPENAAFVPRFRERFGAGRVINDPMMTAYVNVWLWAQSVRQAGSSDPQAVLGQIGKQKRLTPAGMVQVDHQNHHLWKKSRIGRVMANGQFDVVWESEQAIEPVPFPSSRTPAEWTNWLQRLYTSWAGHWQNPGENYLAAARRQGAEGMVRLAKLAENPELVAALLAATGTRKPFSKHEIATIEERWAIMPASDALMQSLLNGKGAGLLKSFQKQYPDFAEIFVTDVGGANVFMAGKTSDFYQADEQWWVDTYASGSGASGQGEIEYDDSAGLWSIPLYRPVRDAKGKVVGVMKAVLSVESIVPLTGAGK